VSGLPTWAVVPSADLVDGSKRVRRARSILLLANLPGTLRRRLKDRGAQLMEVFDMRSAAKALAEADFDAAIIDVHAPGNGAGLVKWIKYGAFLREVGRTPRKPSAFDDLVDRQEGVLEVELSVAAAARNRHRTTPFFLVLEDQPQFGVVVSWPEHSYSETGDGISLPDAVMTLDVAKLLSRGSAMA
jgi:hypothetical protein